jgi:hypothetical protein
MPSPVYQNMVNLVVHLSVTRCEFMNVTMWEHCTFDIKIFGCGKGYYSNSIIITKLVQKFEPINESKLNKLLNISVVLDGFSMSTVW